MKTTRSSRREFLQLSGLAFGTLCAGGLLQACGGAPASASPATASSPPAAKASTGPASKPSASGPAAAASPASASGPAKPQAESKLIVSWGAPAGSFAPLWMAKEIGAFEKHGVAVDVRYVETSTAMPAMIAQSIDLQEVSAAPVITADVNGHEDLVMIASALNHPILALYTVPSIKTAAQLKGEVVASDRPGTPVDYACRLSLSLLGLKPSDVEIRPVGNDAAITPALLSGQVPAGMSTPPLAFKLEDKGFHILQDIYSQPYQNVALVAKRSRLDELAPQLRPLLAAYRDGILAWNNQPDLAMRVLDKYDKIGDPEILKKTYEFFRTTAPFQTDLQPTMKGIQAMMDFLSTAIPGVKAYKPEQFVDTRFLSELPK